MSCALTALAVLASSGHARAGDIDSSLGRIFGLEEVDEDNLDIWEDHEEAHQKVLDLRGRIITIPYTSYRSRYNTSDPAIQRTFFLCWVPDDFEDLDEKRVMVMLHGHKGNAYEQILSMQELAYREEFGLVAIQWGWPNEDYDDGRYRYLSPQVVYDELICKIMIFLGDRYEIDKNLCAWNGFNISSTPCAVYARLDKQTGNHFFRLFIAVSGQISPKQAIMRDMLDGLCGSEPLEGCHFYLWAGKRDRNRADLMEESRETIEDLGGTVDRFAVGPEGSAGFYQKEDHKLEAVRLWESLDGRD
jgi:hypothetical protein